MLYEEMIRASASYADIYPAMRRLESFRSFWLRRHLLTLDFSEGERTWVERQSPYQAHYLCDTFISSYANPIDQADNFH